MWVCLASSARRHTVTPSYGFRLSGFRHHRPRHRPTGRLARRVEQRLGANRGRGERCSDRAHVRVPHRSRTAHQATTDSGRPLAARHVRPPAYFGRVRPLRLPGAVRTTVPPSARTTQQGHSGARLYRDQQSRVYARSGTGGASAPAGRGNSRIPSPTSTSARATDTRRGAPKLWTPRGTRRSLDRGLGHGEARFGSIELIHKKREGQRTSAPSPPGSSPRPQPAGTRCPFSLQLGAGRLPSGWWLGYEQTALAAARNRTREEGSAEGRPGSRIRVTTTAEP